MTSEQVFRSNVCEESINLGSMAEVTYGESVKLRGHLIGAGRKGHRNQRFDFRQVDL
jgi:hypothetical protein